MIIRWTLSSLLAATSVAAQLDWNSVTPALAPSSRSLHRIVDAGPMGIILFGGESSYSQATTVADTWRWANGTWTRLTPPISPRPRCAGGMCYDPVRQRIVYFGGWTGNSYLNDTWEFDGTTWSDVTPAVSPAPRDWPAVAFDPISQRVLLFGGHDWRRAAYGDTWAWDGSTWTQLAPTSAPSPRLGGAMATCSWIGAPILYGGAWSSGGQSVYGTDLWMWLGNDWVNIDPATPVPGRILSQACCDPRRERFVIVGGQDNLAVLGDVWEFDVRGWTQRTPSGSGPVVHDGAAFYDESRSEILFFGGATSHQVRTSVTNAMWSLAPINPAVARAFGSPCGGGPVLDASHLAWVGGSYRITITNAPPNAALIFAFGLSRSSTSSGVPLPLALDRLGMPGCALQIDPQDSVVISADAAGNAVNQFVVPNVSTLLGVWAYSQVAMPAAAANLAGLAMSNAVEHQLGGL